MTWKTILACAVCLALGLVIGRVMPTSDAPMRESDKESLKGRKSSRQLASRRGSPVELRSRSASRSGDGGVLDEQSGLLAIGGQEVLVVVPASLLGDMSQAASNRSMAQDLFSRDGKLEAHLQIKEKEKVAIQRAWRQVQAKVRKMEVDSAESEDLQDGSVRITVPDLRDGMGELGTDFQTSVGEVLGGNRAEVFLAMKQVGGMFSPVEGMRTYTVKMETIGDGRWRYHMNSDGPGGRKSWVGERIPPAIRHLTDFAKIKSDLNPPDAEEDEE